MKLIIAGSRSIDQYDRKVRDLIYSVDASEVWPSTTEVVSGKAKGVDTLGEMWASETATPVKDFPADWETHGKKAGHIRNKQMAEYADAALIIWDGKSKGTRNMIDQMFALKKPVLVFFMEPNRVLTEVPKDQTTIS